MSGINLFGKPVSKCNNCCCCCCSCQDTPAPKPFPKLMREKDSGMIVLMLSSTVDGAGVVLNDAPLSPWKSGHYSLSWSLSSFTDYHGTVTLGG